MRTFVIPVLLAISTICSSQNLVINPGFEEWDETGKPVGWTHAESYSKEATEIHSGIFSCLHSGTTSTKDLGQTIPVTPGKEYTLSLFYKTAQPTTGNGSRIWCYWKKDSVNNFTDTLTDALMRPTKYLKSDTWQEFSITVTAPSPATFFYLELRTNSNSKMYWDDISFSESVVTWDRELNQSKPVIYPVPADNQVNIEGITTPALVEIVDFHGDKLMSALADQGDRISLPVAWLQPGMYFARIKGSRFIILRFVKR